MIRQLSIENFKCFKNQTLEFGRLTVLSGANGVGKSTVVQSLLLVRETRDSLHSIVTRQTVGSDEATSPVSLNGPYGLSLGNSSVVTNAELESDRLAITIRDDREATSRFEFLADSETPRTTIDYLRTSSDTGTDAAFEDNHLFSPEFHYLVAERVGPRDLYGMADQPFVSTGIAGEFTAQAISRSVTRDVAPALCLATDTALFRVQLEAWLDQITPGIQIETNDYPEVNRVRVGIRRKGMETDWLSPSNIGFGISYVLPVVVSGLLAPPGSILVVENPEAHLHPAAQSAIGRFLTRVALSGVQVVIETHSENVVNGARLEAILGDAGGDDIRFLFFNIAEGRAEPDISTISMDERGELSNWPIGFFDQQTKDLAELFRARRTPTAI